MSGTTTEDVREKGVKRNAEDGPCVQQDKIQRNSKVARAKGVKRAAEGVPENPNVGTTTVMMTAAMARRRSEQRRVTPFAQSIINDAVNLEIIQFTENLELHLIFSTECCMQYVTKFDDLAFSLHECVRKAFIKELRDTGGYKVSSPLKYPNELSIWW